MKNIIPIFITVLIISSFAFTGCKTTKGIKSLGTFKIDNPKQDPTSIHWAYMDSNTRQSVIFVNEEGTHIVSEPSPDTAVNATIDLANELKLHESLDSELKLKYATEVVQLGKRTVATTILRDALYKLSELRASGKSLEKSEVELFMKILDSAEKIAIAEVTAQQAEVAAQQVNLIQQLGERFKAIPEQDRTDGLALELLNKTLNILNSEPTQTLEK